MAQAVDVVSHACGFKVKGACFVVQGFGAVGSHVSRFLAEQGALLVGVSDSQGAIVNESGLDVAELLTIKAEGKSVTEYRDAVQVPSDDLVEIECDIWIPPAARPDVIHKDNVQRMNTRVVVQGGKYSLYSGGRNVPSSAWCVMRPLILLPMLVGVICAAMEYHGSTQAAAFDAIENKVRSNTEQVLKRMNDQFMLPREAAVALAKERLSKIMATRRYSLFSTAPPFSLNCLTSIKLSRRKNDQLIKLCDVIKEKYLCINCVYV